MIDTEDKLAAFLPKLRAADWIALDTEADSLHAYPEKLCLLQISITGTDAIVDPLAGLDLAPVLEILGRHEVIMHGADYDLRLLRKAFGFVPGGIFDTMIAARLLGCQQFGLSSLVARFLGIALEKGAQKANWARRPLTTRMEIYARNDTHYLKPLADLLREQLQAKVRLGWQQESCARLIAECAQFRPADPDMMWRVKGSHQLGPRGLAVLRELWHWREKEAIKFNRPPYFVLASETMVDLAEAAEEADSIHDLLPRHVTPRRRSEILQAIKRGLAVERPPGILKPVHYRQTEAEKRRMNELERRRNTHAEALAIDRTLIASRAMLVMLARDWHAHQKELMRWQQELLEQDGAEGKRGVEGAGRKAESVMRNA